MQKINLEKYNNLLDTFKMTDTDIINQLSNYKLEFHQTRNERVEWNVQLPTFIVSFYNYLKIYSSLPSQEEFYNFYINQNADFFIKEDFNDDEIEGIKARVYRTYPSLVRDIHFSTFLKNRIEGTCQVIYNVELDMSEGIDVLIIKDDKKFGINLFTETPTARVGRHKKSYKHDQYEDVTYLDVPVTINKAYSISNFCLYGHREMMAIQEIINN